MISYNTCIHTYIHARYFEVHKQVALLFERLNADRRTVAQDPNFK